MDAFPTAFAKRDITVARGSHEDIVVWSIFERKLLAHFYSYHRVRDHLGTQALFQVRSCLDEFDSGSFAVSSVSDDASVDIEDSERRSHNSEFEEVYVARCDAHGRISEDESVFLKRALSFFLLVFRLRAKESKDALEKMRHHLFVWKKELEVNERTIQDVRSRLEFLRGTTTDADSRGEERTISEPGPDRMQDAPASGPHAHDVLGILQINPAPALNATILQGSSYLTFLSVSLSKRLATRFL